MPTTGDRIRDARKAKNMTQAELADKVGVKFAAIHKYETGLIVNLKRDTISALAHALDVSPSWLMCLDDSEVYPSNVSPMPALRRVPRLGAIACGTPILAQENLDGYDEVPDYVKCDFTLTCKGDSMTGARIYDGDVVCIRKQETAENGQIAAVLIDDESESGSATLKRIRFISGGVVLYPENSAYEPLIFSGEEANRVHILGIATHFISRVV